jgi:hypothetical protein
MCTADVAERGKYEIQQGVPKRFHILSPTLADVIRTFRNQAGKVKGKRPEGPKERGSNLIFADSRGK